MLAFQPERVRPITCPAFRAGLFESPLDPPGWAGAQPCPIILVGPVAVGTPVTERPPHRTRRAQLRHRAPTSGG